MIRENPRLTYKDIELVLTISLTSVSTNLYEHLCVKKKFKIIVTGDETWLYQFDPETKHQSSICVFPDDQPPIKVKTPKSVGKEIVFTFFSTSDHLTTVVLQNQKTFTAKWYTEVCLPKMFKKKKKRVQRQD